MLMVFHIDAGITILQELIDHDLIDSAELGDILSERESESDSVQEERVWSAMRAFLFQEGKIINFPKDLQGPDSA
tara:strand:+ start:566 stop:790 length:225 start_codon:yes stop_codon:yes gene_type:complete